MVLIRLAKFVTAGFLAVVPIAVLPPDDVADPNVAVLAFGLVGSQSVFESEAKGSAAILAQRLGAGTVGRAFDEARAIVRQRELHYHLVPSNPQIAGGENMDLLLRKTGGAEAFGRQP
jgi:hypothetical protein